MDSKNAIDTFCDYCNASCDTNLITLKGKNFCCYGCATLDDVIKKIKSESTEVSLKYRQFDEPESFDQLVDYQNTTIYKIGISLPSIHCSSCIELLEDLPSFTEGIISSRVNFERRMCTITASKEIPLSRVAQWLDDIGYPPQISINQKLNEDQKSSHRSTLFKLAVAGFCFGNIMLFSMPHYFGLAVAEDAFFARLFSALSIALSLPVLFYSGKEYLSSAYKALSAGKSHINIPIAIGIVSLFGWSIYEIISGNGVGYLDSLAGLIFFLLIGKWFQHKVYDQVSFHRSIQDFIPLVVRKQVSNNYEWTRIDALGKGDTIQIKNNEVIPVNGYLRLGSGLVDYAFITGEALPERLRVGDKLYAGGCQKSGEITVELIEKPSIDKLWSTWNSGSHEKEFSNTWTDSISSYFTIAVMVIAVIAAIVWSFIDISNAVFVFSAVLIVACPCALALSAPFTYGSIQRVFSTNNFFLKKANAVLPLGKIDHVVLDKTGTLTTKKAVDVSFVGNTIQPEDLVLIKSLALQSNHPFSRIIASHLDKTKAIEVANFQEVAGSGVSALVGERNVKLGSSSWVNTKDQSNSSAVYVSIDGNVLGHYEINSSYRKGLKSMLHKLGKMVNISILSGDNDSERKALFNLYPYFKKLKFNLKPFQKANQIKTLQKEENVLMLGDGLNDSGAIEAGNLGVAITENLNGFYPGSDAVLMSESLNKLPAFIELSKYSKKILKWSLVFSLGYNIIGLSFAVMGLLTPIIAAILMPISSITIVVLDTLLVRLKSKKLKLI